MADYVVNMQTINIFTDFFSHSIRKECSQTTNNTFAKTGGVAT
jgi:hypothetical protein